MLQMCYTYCNFTNSTPEKSYDMNTKKINIHDVAAHSGVSTATVSRVINQKKNVKQETIEKVFASMKTLGYDTLIKTLPKDINKDLIIFNLPSTNNPFCENVIKGAQASAMQHGYYLLTNQSPINYETIDNTMLLLQSTKPAGMIILDSVQDEFLQRLMSQTNIVLCNEHSDTMEVSSVIIDDYLACKNATEYLISCGYKNFAFVNGPERFRFSQERFKGFSDALSNAKIEIEPRYIVQLSDIDFTMAYSAANHLIMQNPRPQAVVTVSDLYAAAIIKSARKAGLQVPNDIAVLGFDNVDISIMSDISITTVDQPKFQMGYDAAELLIEKINNPESKHRQIVLNTQLILRESTSYKAL